MKKEVSLAVLKDVEFKPRRGEGKYEYSIYSNKDHRLKISNINDEIELIELDRCGMHFRKIFKHKNGQVIKRDTNYSIDEIKSIIERMLKNSSKYIYSSTQSNFVIERKYQTIKFIDKELNEIIYKIIHSNIVEIHRNMDGQLTRKVIKYYKERKKSYDVIVIDYIYDNGMYIPVESRYSEKEYNHLLSSGQLNYNEHEEKQIFRF